MRAGSCRSHAKSSRTRIARLVHAVRSTSLKAGDGCRALRTSLKASVAVNMRVACGSTCPVQRPYRRAAFSLLTLIWKSHDAHLRLKGLGSETLLTFGAERLPPRLRFMGSRALLTSGAEPLPPRLAFII